MTIFLIVKGLCLRILVNLGTYKPGHKNYSNLKQREICCAACFNIFESKSIIPVNFFSTNSRQDGWITSVHILKLCLLKKAVRCVIKTTVRAALLQVFWVSFGTQLQSNEEKVAVIVSCEECN